jgi:iron complex outermembrane receptor protein
VYQHFVDQYDDNIADYTAAFPAADTDGDGIVSLDEYMAQVGGGKTYETILKEYSVNPPIQTTDRDRIQGELNFEIGDNLLQFMGMRLEEELSVWNETYSDTTGVILMQGPRTFLNSNHAGMAVNSELEENYAEVRWVSPADKRLRYTLSGSWYAYKFNQQNVRNYGVIQHGLTMADGSPIRILSGVAISEETNNLGASFGLQYDLSDTTTLSFEGRVQDDEVCAETIEGQKCVSTESFAPRIAISKSVGQHDLYAQFSIGNNPAGNNPIFYDPGVIESLLVASGQIVSPEDGFTYDGSDGVHFAAVTYDASVYESYEEETLTNYEVGSKGSFSDGRGSYAVAFYYMFYEDRLGVSTLNWNDDSPNGWNFTGWADNTLARSNINSGDSEYYGVELETNFQVSDVWAVGGYVTYGKAKYTDYCAVEAVAFTDSPTPGGNYIAEMRDPAAGDDVVSLCGIVDGNTVPQHADLTARLSVDATLPNDIFGFGTTLSADWTYKGTYYEDHTNLVERAAVDQLNISANMRNDSWTIRLYVNNVTDEDDTNSLLWPTNYYVNNANPTLAPSSQPTWAFTPKPGREFGIQVGFGF